MNTVARQQINTPEVAVECCEWLAFALKTLESFSSQILHESLDVEPAARSDRTRQSVRRVRRVRGTFWRWLPFSVVLEATGPRSGVFQKQ